MTWSEITLLDLIFKPEVLEFEVSPWFLGIVWPTRWYLVLSFRFGCWWKIPTGDLSIWSFSYETYVQQDAIKWAKFAILPTLHKLAVFYNGFYAVNKAMLKWAKIAIEVQGKRCLLQEETSCTTSSICIHYWSTCKIILWRLLNCKLIRNLIYKDWNARLALTH